MGFLKNYPFSDVTETNGSFVNFFENFKIFFFNFPEKTEKKFISYKSVKKSDKV